jgi:hypothetical protein
MAKIVLGTKQYDDYIFEQSVDIALDTAAELNLLVKSDTASKAKDLLLKSSLTMLGASGFSALASLTTKVATAFQTIPFGDNSTSAMMMANDFLNSEPVLSIAATAGAAGAIGVVTALTIKSLVKAIDDLAVKMDPTLISKRQTELAKAYGEIFDYEEQRSKDRSLDNIKESYDKLRPIAEKIGFSDDKADHIFYEWLSSITNETMKPEDPGVPKVIYPINNI